MFARQFATGSRQFEERNARPTGAPTAGIVLEVRGETVGLSGSGVLQAGADTTRVG